MDKKINCFVMAVHKERYDLLCNGERFFARLKSSVFYNNSDEVYPTVGDNVECIYNPDGDSLITKVLSRKSVFLRQNSSQGMPDQAVAANFDYVFIVQSLNRDYNLSKLERYLTIAWQSGGIPVIILSKADLCENVEQYIAEAQSAAPGVDIIAVSTYTGEGIDTVKNYLQAGRIAVLLGSSGVGKSTLTNALLGTDEMETGDIREYDSQGRHTTTYRQCFELDNGGKIIDTPGMRRLLPGTDTDEGMGASFEDIEELILQCKFSNCTHKSEPGCAIQRALKEGTLERKKWDTFLSMQRENEYAKQRAQIIERKRMKKNKKSS